jgi:hypothetical protein
VRCASGGRYLERIKADRHAAKLGGFVLELIRKIAAFATLLICPCARPKQPKVSGQFGTQTLVRAAIAGRGIWWRACPYLSSVIRDLQQSREMRQNDTALDEISACQMLSLVLCAARPVRPSGAAGCCAQRKVAVSTRYADRLKRIAVHSAPLLRTAAPHGSSLTAPCGGWAGALATLATRLDHQLATRRCTAAPLATTARPTATRAQSKSALPRSLGLRTTSLPRCTQRRRLPAVRSGGVRRRWCSPVQQTV